MVVVCESNGTLPSVGIAKIQVLVGRIDIAAKGCQICVWNALVAAVSNVADFKNHVLN